MRLSARNQISGNVKRIEKGTIISIVAREVIKASSHYNQP